MGTFILILYLSGYNAGGPAAVKFNDKAACEAAGEQIKTAFRGRFRSIEW